jgi:hypothetical protein
MKHSIAAKAQPENTDASVRAATGRGWDEWRELIDAWPGHERGHTAIAAHLQAVHGVDSWWAQAVTVGYERITGRRLRYQRADGSFEANVSRTLVADAAALRAQLLDARSRSALFPGIATTLRSRAESKNVRIGIGPGIAEISLTAQADGRTKATVAHHQLQTPEDVVHWKAWWAQWLLTIGAGRADSQASNAGRSKPRLRSPAPG